MKQGEAKIKAGTTVVIVFLITAILSGYSKCFSQEQTPPKKLKNKVGVGALYLGGHHILLMASYSRILKGKNDLECPVSYSSNGNIQEIIGGISINMGLIKRDIPLNIYVCVSLLGNYYWAQLDYRSTPASRQGFITALGIVSEYKFTSHFSVSLEIKVGEGYNWTDYKSNGHNYPGYVSGYELWQDGLITLFQAGIKMKYYF